MTHWGLKSVCSEYAWNWRRTRNTLSFSRIFVVTLCLKDSCGDIFHSMIFNYLNSYASSLTCVNVFEVYFLWRVFPTNLSHKEIIYNPSSVQMHTIATGFIYFLFIQDICFAFPYSAFRPCSFADSHSAFRGSGAGISKINRTLHRT